MDKYISDIVQVYLSIFFLIMLSNELISGSIFKKRIGHFAGYFDYLVLSLKVCKPIFLSLYLKSIN